MAQLLLERNSDIKARNNHSQTPLHLAARNNSTEVAQLLLEHNPDIEAKDKANQTPLHHAARNNSIEVAQLLLERNPDIYARDIDFQTPFEVARSSPKNTEGVIRLLMEHTSVEPFEF